MIANWSGNVRYGAERLVRPRTVAELQEVVATSARVKALGSRHSFSRVADTTGTLVSTADVALPVAVEGDLAIVPGGLRYSEVIPVVEAHGRAFPNLGSLPHITVAGAAATGTHGSGSRNACLAAGVRAVEFVRADGELVLLRDGADGFPGAVLALGAIGVVTRLWVRTVPSFRMRQTVWLDAPRHGVLEQLLAILDCAYSVSLFIQPGRPELVDQIWVKSRADTEAPDGTQWGAHAAPHPVHPIAGQDAAATTPQLGAEHAWHEVLPHFRASFTPSNGDELQSEYFVGREHAAAALDTLLGLGLDDVVQVMEVRSVAADDLWLGTAHGRDSVTLHFTWVPDEDAVRRACERVEAALAGYDPRPHWGKVFAMPFDQLRAKHPHRADAAALAARMDPGRKFANPFLEQLVY